MQDEVYRDFIRYGWSGIDRIVGFVWIIFGMIILVNIVKDNIKYRIDKWKREREVMKEWERINNGETDRKNY